MNARVTEDGADGFEIFPWSPNFETGIDLIDQQHRKLVVLLNRLAEQHVRGVSGEAVEQILGELADYADYHFRTEDEIWGRHLGEDAWVTGHAQTHARFFETVTDLRAGGRALGAVLEDLLSFLTRWLAYHILDSDKRMARAVLAVQAGCTVAVAKQRADDEMHSGTELLVHTVLSMYQRLSAQALELMREKHARLCAESALTVSEERWKFLLEDAGEGVWEWDDAGFCTDLEGGVPEIRLLEQMVEGDWRVHGDDFQRVRASFIAHLAGVEDSLTCQYRIVSPGGALRWMRMRGRVIQRDREGRALRMIGARQDVTERELARQIVAHGHEVLFITDADNCIIAANPAFARLTGYPLEEVVGRAPRILRSERHPETFFTDMWRQLREHGCWEGEIWNRRKDGVELTLFMSIHRLYAPDGSIGQYVAIGFDITAYKTAQAQLQRQHDRQQMVSELAARMLATTTVAEQGEVLQDILGRTAASLHADRARVFQIAPDQSHVARTHEWCRAGEPADIPLMLPFGFAAWLLGQMAANGHVRIDDGAALPEEHAPAYRQIALPGPCSLIAVPLCGAGADLGFLCMDTARECGAWDGEEVGFLSLTASIIASTLLRQRADSSLRASEQNYEVLFESIPDSVIVVDGEQGNVVHANQQAGVLLARSLDALIGMPFSALYPPGLSDVASVPFGETDREKDAIQVCESVVRARSGVDVPVEVSTGRSREVGGRRYQVGVFRDIRDRKRNQRALHEERQRLQSLLDAVQAGTWEWNVQTGELRVNGRWGEIIGYRLDELMPVTIATWDRLVHPEDYLVSARLLSDHFAGQLERYECELRMLHKNGDWVWIRDLGRVISWDAGGKPVWMAGIHLDITAQKTHQQQLDFVANHDVLTRLPNRTLLTDRLEVAMAECRRARRKLAVAYIDLDGFARINETHGRAVGDRLLVTLTGRIRECLREANGLARIGGDEFAVLLTAIDHRDECLPPVLRLLEVISLPLALDTGVVYLSASIGVALFEEGIDADAEQLLRQADQAMYQAKLAGKNRYHFFDPEHDQTVRGHLGTIDEIRHALANDEFVLHYQPKVNMRTGALIGLEALIRWQHPQRGLQPPAMFIPLLEGHPMSIVLGDWVIETALAQLAEWKRGGFETSISVNISVDQLQDPDFVARLERQMLAQPDVAPRQLELEILETGALEDMAHVEQLVARCRALDVCFALDDFGTGYSSLTYLKRLAAATIKIDQSFVRGMLEDIEHVAIINSVLGLAHTFDRQPLAEGVETEVHGEMLLQLGCELGQGFGIARPMPAAAVSGWRDAWRPPISWRRSRALGPEEMTVLMAEVEHRGWHHALQSFLRGECKQPPPLESNSCRFDRWLRTAVRHERFSDEPGLSRLGELHECLHQTGRRIVALIDAGEHETLAREGETLARHSQALVESLRDLRRKA